jgi:hypothetical protein
VSGGLSRNGLHFLVEGQPKAFLPFAEEFLRVALDWRIVGLVNIEGFDMEGVAGVTRCHLKAALASGEKAEASFPESLKQLAVARYNALTVP